MCDLMCKDCVQSKNRTSKLFWDTLLFPCGPLFWFYDIRESFR